MLSCGLKHYRIIFLQRVVCGGLDVIISTPGYYKIWYDDLYGIALHGCEDQSLIS